MNWIGAEPVARSSFEWSCAVIDHGFEIAIAAAALKHFRSQNSRARHRLVQPNLLDSPRTMADKVSPLLQQS
jgi:hypothetical protein